MARFIVWLGIAFLLAPALVGAVAQDDLTGRWDVTATFTNGSASGGMTIATERGKISGTAEPLDENQFFPLTMKGRQRPDGADLDISYREPGSF